MRVVTIEIRCDQCTQLITEPGYPIRRVQFDGLRAVYELIFCRIECERKWEQDHLSRETQEVE